MSYLPYVESFRELLAHQKAKAIAKEIFQLTKAFPREEAYSLIDQIRRSSRSIGAQTGEAWGKRSYEKHFISKLTDADGEQLETQHWIDTAADCGYLNTTQASSLVKQCEEIGRLLGGMIAKSAKFCSTAPPAVVREDTAVILLATKAMAN